MDLKKLFDSMASNCQCIKMTNPKDAQRLASRFVTKGYWFTMIRRLDGCYMSFANSIDLQKDIPSTIKFNLESVSYSIAEGKQEEKHGSENAGSNRQNA